MGALKPFLHGFINITLLATFFQFIGLFIITALFAVTHLMHHSLGYVLYILVGISYYVFVEEMLKLFFSLKARCDVPVMQIGKSHTITSTATALGYSMATGLIWTGIAAFAMKKDDASDDEKYSLFGWLFVITFLIAIIGMPMHLITGYVMGCSITKIDLDHNNDADNENAVPQLGFAAYVNVIRHAVFIRASYLFFLVIGFLVIQFSVLGVFISLIGIVIDYVLIIKHCKFIESTLPFDYLQRAGQLSIFGYNVLSDGSGNDEHFYNDVSMNYEEDNTMTAPVVQITTASLAKYEKDSGMDLEAPMILKADKEQNIVVEKRDENDTKVHVNDAIFSRSESASEDDSNNSNIR